MNGAPLSLDGVWRLRTADETASVPCPVPGDNYSALQDAGRIPDPFRRENEDAVQWVADRDWVFSRSFEVPPALLRHAAVFLSFDSIDTAAAVFVNGRRAGSADDQFRRWRFEVRRLLRPGENEVEVRIESPRRAARRVHDAEAPGVELARVNDGSVPGLNCLRKCQCSAGWDWGISLPASGLYGGVSLFGADAAVLDAAWCGQRHRGGSCAVAAVARLLPVPGARPGTPVEATFSFGGETKTVRGRVPAAGSAFELLARFNVASPRLWWPRGFGEQNLYPFSVSVGDQRIERRIGLRRLEVDTKPDRDGAPLAIRVNGVPVFAKGADWIPCDARPRHETPDRVRDLLQSAAAAEMNLLRVWGGGHFESDFFYDECDRLGLLLWHDMMFACSRYPANRAFLGRVRAEILHQVRRLRDHPSIALWCGDNECVGAVRWDSTGPDDRRRRLARYKRLNAAVGAAVREADPTRLFWPSSPSAGPGNFVYNDANSGRGDTHFWGVWHGRARFEAYYGHRPRFCSEFGFQSFPSLETVRAFASEADGDFNLFSPVMDRHQKNRAGNSIILGMFGNYFRMPRDFAETLYLSQVQQAEAIRTGVEWFRSQRPRCMGTVYWQLDDNWPVASWSSIEWGGRWKALHHAARRFYAPLAAFVFRPGDGKPLEAHLVWDLPVAVDVRVAVSLRRVADGAPLAGWTFRETLPRAASRRLPLPDQPLRADAFLSVETTGRTADGRVFRHEGTVNLDAWKHCDLPRANLRVRSVRPAPDEPGAFDVSLAADAPAFFALLSVEGDPQARFSDNLLTVLPGGRTVRVRPGRPATAAGLRRRLSLADLRSSY